MVTTHLYLFKIKIFYKVKSAMIAVFTPAACFQTNLFWWNDPLFKKFNLLVSGKTPERKRMKFMS